MKIQRKVVEKRTQSTFFALVIILLLILLIGFFVFYKFYDASKKYKIENGYYGFLLQTPKDWLGQENILYSKENIGSILDTCNQDTLAEISNYQIGVFRFTDKKYPEGFGDGGYFPKNMPSGAILEVIVNCVPEYIKNQIAGYESKNVKLDGSETLVNSLNIAGFGDTRHLAFFHNNFEYKINEYIYIAPQDKGKDENVIKNKYTDDFNKIISSFQFVN